MKNALQYSKRLESAGLSREQAEAHLEILSEVVEDEMATKTDLERLEQKMSAGFQQMEYRLTIKLGAFMVVAVGAVAALVRVL
jgi:hypothetical protein